MLLYALLEAASCYLALDCNQYSAQRKYCKEDLSQALFNKPKLCARLNLMKRVGFL